MTKTHWLLPGFFLKQSILHTFVLCLSAVVSLPAPARKLSSLSAKHPTPALFLEIFPFFFYTSAPSAPIRKELKTSILQKVRP